jgi:hypothetical protein
MQSEEGGEPEAALSIQSTPMHAYLSYKYLEDVIHTNVGDT